MINKQKAGRLCLLLWLGLVLLRAPALAYSEELIPVGAVVGIQMNTDGVLVADTPEVITDEGARRPAAEAGLRPGDLIVAVNGQSTRTAAELSEALRDLDEETVTLTVQRDGQTLTLSVRPARQADGSRRLGLWLRDGIAGLGTVTFIDPATGQYGALGHGVNDVQTGVLLPLGQGQVCRAQVVDVTKGRVGEPGALSGSYDMSETLGSIEQNTPCGIFGTMDQPLSGLGRAIPVAERSEVENGPAVILSTVQGRQVEAYDVQITRGPEDSFHLRVTDPELLSLTGGIVQGMSGSPIIQDGKLVGAVTHVLVNDPTRGYGIFIETMLAAAG